MMQPDRDMVRKRFGLEMNPLIGAPMVGVLHDVAGRLVHGQLQLGLAVLVER